MRNKVKHERSKQTHPHRGRRSPIEHPSFFGADLSRRDELSVVHIVHQRDRAVERDRKEDLIFNINIKFDSDAIEAATKNIVDDLHKLRQKIHIEQTAGEPNYASTSEFRQARWITEAATEAGAHWAKLVEIGPGYIALLLYGGYNRDTVMASSRNRVAAGVNIAYRWLDDSEWDLMRKHPNIFVVALVDELRKTVQGTDGRSQTEIDSALDT